MENEIWKDIPFFKGRYQASNKGRIRSLDWIYQGVSKTGNPMNITKKGKILKSSLSRGYLRVVIFDKGERKSKMVHQLVAMAFLNHKPNGYEKVVDHINFIKTDNRVENLDLVSPRKNTTKDNFRYNYSSRYIGVCWDKNKNKWRVMIQINKKNIFLGNFDNEYDAHLAYQNKLKSI